LTDQENLFQSLLNKVLHGYFLVKDSLKMISGISRYVVLRSKALNRSVILKRNNSNGGQHNDQNVIKRYINNVLDNPLPLGVGALVVGILQLRRIRDRERHKDLAQQSSCDEYQEDPLHVTCYKSLPLRHLSRLWGSINEVYLPVILRRFVLGLYVKAFGCNLDEAENNDLDAYENLGQFFRRKLKDGVRTIDESVCLVSPCDGKVLHWGKIKDEGSVEQVKGVSYKLQHFLGNHKNLTDVEVESISKPGETDEPSSTCLYQCVLYLAPGDYHCFHSPADWKILTRRHFPGELLSVSPGIVSKIKGLFSLNERLPI